MNKTLLGMVAVTAMFTGSANASLMMTLSDGTDSVSVTDNGTGDASSLLGALTYNGTLGSWLVNVTTGISKPILSGPGTVLDLNSINVSGGSGILTISLVDTDFDALGSISSNVGGTTNGDFSLDTFLDSSSSGVAGAGTNIFSFTGSNGAFSGNGGLFAAPATNYGLSLVATINHTSLGQITSFDAGVNVPEPSIIALFGLGLIGLGFASRKNKQA